MSFDSGYKIERFINRTMILISMRTSTKERIISELDDQTLVNLQWELEFAREYFIWTKKLMSMCGQEVAWRAHSPDTSKYSNRLKIIDQGDLYTLAVGEYCDRFKVNPEIEWRGWIAPPKGFDTVEMESSILTLVTYTTKEINSEDVLILDVCKKLNPCRLMKQTEAEKYQKDVGIEGRFTNGISPDKVFKSHYTQRANKNPFSGRVALNK